MNDPRDIDINININILLTVETSVDHMRTAVALVRAHLNGDRAARDILAADLTPDGEMRVVVAVRCLANAMNEILGETRLGAIPAYTGIEAVDANVALVADKMRAVAAVRGADEVVMIEALATNLATLDDGTM